MKTALVTSIAAKSTGALGYRRAVPVGAGAVVPLRLHRHRAERADRASTGDYAHDLGAEHARLAPADQAAKRRVLRARLQVEALQREQPLVFQVAEADLAHGELDVVNCRDRSRIFVGLGARLLTVEPLHGLIEPFADA